MKMRRRSSAALLLRIVALAALECGLFGVPMMWSVRHFHRHFGSGAAFTHFFIVLGLSFGLCMLTAILLGWNIGKLLVQTALNQALEPETRVVDSHLPRV